MMRMYAITVFKSFQGHVVGPPTQSTGTILDQLFVVRPVDFARLACDVPLTMFLSSNSARFIYFFFYICCYLHFDFDTYIP